jgi:hypothetical protein
VFPLHDFPSLKASKHHYFFANCSKTLYKLNQLDEYFNSCRLKDTCKFARESTFQKDLRALKGSESLLPITRQNNTPTQLAYPKAVVGVSFSQPPLKLINESLSPLQSKIPKNTLDCERVVVHRVR